MEPKRDFRELYCEHHGLNIEQYPEHILRQSLYPHARGLAHVLRFVLILFYPHYFRADFEFLHDIGCMKHYRDFNQSARIYNFHPSNHRNVLRRFLKLRLSTKRIRRLVRCQLRSAAHSSRTVEFQDQASRSSEITVTLFPPPEGSHDPLPQTGVAKNTPQRRREFAAMANAGDASVRELCLRFGISRSTGYKWIKHMNRSDHNGMTDRTSPAHTLFQPDRSQGGASLARATQRPLEMTSPDTEPELAEHIQAEAADCEHRRSYA